VAEKRTTGGYSGIPTTTVAPKPVTSNKKATTSTDKEILKSLSGLSKSLGALGGVVESLGSTTATAPSGSDLLAAQLAEAQAIAAANAAESARQQQAAEAERARRAGQSAYDILLTEFGQYGLASLVEPLKNLIVSGPSSAELTLALRATDAYKKRFAANTERIKKGLTALNEATYLGLEDKYQSVMRNYGLPATYYAKFTSNI